MAKGTRRITAILALSLLTAGIAGGVRAEGNAVDGQKVFRKCAACHSLEAGKIKIGPPLHGIFGRSAGSVDGFRYSRAMKESGIAWDSKTLDGYIAAPAKFIPGNRMPFPGIKDPGDRADLLAYLREAAGGQ